VELHCFQSVFHQKLDVKLAFKSLKLMVDLLEDKTSMQQNGRSSMVKICLETTECWCCFEAAGRQEWFCP